MLQSTNIINVYGQYPNHTSIEKEAVKLASTWFPSIGQVCLKTQIDPQDRFDIIGHIHEFYLVRICTQREYDPNIGLTPIIGWIEKNNKMINVDTKADTNIDIDQDILHTALQFLGTPYLWGGKSTEATDCSGLTYQIYRDHGIILPRFSWGQFKIGQKIEPTELQIGDLIFVCSGEQGKPIHVLMYLGSNYPLRNKRSISGAISSHFEQDIASEHEYIKRDDYLIEACGLPGIFITRITTFQERWPSAFNRSSTFNGSFARNESSSLDNLYDGYPISERDRLFFRRISI